VLFSLTSRNFFDLLAYFLGDSLMLEQCVQSPGFLVFSAVSFVTEFKFYSVVVSMQGIIQFSYIC
jgi:hypothetical protein